MTRQAGVIVENNFSKGLITESTALQFPPNACVSADNVKFDETGVVSKREGIDFENNYSTIAPPQGTNEAFSEYIWKAVFGSGDRSVFVQQKGRYLYLYDVSTQTEISPNLINLTIDLDTYKPAGTTLVPSQHPCQYAAGNGDLIVVNAACNPFYIVYNPAVGVSSASTSALTIQVRDFRGLNDGLAIDERVTSSAAGLITSNPQHYYNLLNQGWVGGDSLAQWDTALTTMPSNADYVGLFRSSATDAFDPNIVTSRSGYNSPAPKGHYILNAFEPDRTLGGTLTFSGTVALSLPISLSSLTSIGNITSSFLYDGLTSVNHSSNSYTSDTTTGNWMGKTLASGKKASKAVVYGLNNFGFAFGNALGFGGGFSDDAAIAGFTDHIVILKFYGKAGAAPANATDGTLLGTTTFTDTTDESGGREIFSSDNSTSWDHMWVTLDWNQGNISGPPVVESYIGIGEVQFYEYSTTTIASSDDIVTKQRPTTVAFYSGRAFYSGVAEVNLGSNIYFTQIVEKREQLAYCYQKNDPTSEDIPDLLPDDGGLIKVPDAGEIVRLFEFQGALLVLATNGVWLIQGASGGPFQATDYEIKRISSSGTHSPLSIISYRGTPFWWGLEGLFTVTFNPNYNSFSVTNISNNTIQELLDDVPSNNKKYVKGACDTEDSVVYWLYNDTASLPTSDYYKYPKILCMNMLVGSFFPYSISGDPTIRGIDYLQSNAQSSTLSKIKFTTTYTNTSAAGTRDLITFSDFKSGEYTDWTDYAAGVIANINYSSYTKLEDATSGEAAGYDGTTTQAAASCVTKTSATTLYYGATLPAAKKIVKAIIYGSSDQGYVNGANPSVTATLYGKTGAAPASGTDGTSLGSITFTDATGDSTRREINSTNQTTSYDHVWVYITQAGAAATMYLAEVEFYSITADSSKDVDYLASFVTGYRLDAQGNRFFQSNYVHVFLNTVTNSGCFMQGVFDFTNSSNSGKWSSQQQIYNSALTLRDVNHRRLKVRGKGKSLQLRFEGEAAKPFEILGWAIMETSNAGL